MLRPCLEPALQKPPRATRLASPATARHGNATKLKLTRPPVQETHQHPRGSITAPRPGPAPPCLQGRLFGLLLPKGQRGAANSGLPAQEARASPKGRGTDTSQTLLPALPNRRKHFDREPSQAAALAVSVHPAEELFTVLFFPPLTRLQLFLKSSVKQERIALKPFITNHPDQIISVAEREVLKFQPGLMSIAEK